MMDVDFGTYHHSTETQSRELREKAEKAFISLLNGLFSKEMQIRVLDAGCGLGFLSSVVSNCLPNCSVLGVDIFGHNSLSGTSIQKAQENMKKLGLEKKVEFREHDLRLPLSADERFDLSVSNLVFHNLGKKRFDGYDTVFGALRPRGYFVIGDLFPHMNADMKYFQRHATLLNEVTESESGRWSYRIKVLQRK